ncbi:hypothetical protein FDECE_5236 [Fusarium decemcellulare]|nr:hypothetical protein FDECE_5236 [Fusarium decemcellulare]
MASITIRPGTLADSQAISRVHYEALSTYHDFYAAFLQKHPREIISIGTDRALRDPEVVVAVAEDVVAGEIVGFIRYKAINPNSNANKKLDETQAPPAAAPKEHLEDLWQRFCAREAEMDACKKEAVDGQRHYEISNLMVDPAHQRKGIGGRLLKSVIDKADADGAPTVIVSSAEGHGLYLRNSFRVLGTWAIDNERWAGEIAKREGDIPELADRKSRELLVRRCRGMREVEDCMIRLPSFRSS